MRERYRPTRGEGRGSPLTSDPIRISKLTVQDSECPLGSRVPGCVEHHQAPRVCLPGSWREPLLHTSVVRDHIPEDAHPHPSDPNRISKLYSQLGELAGNRLPD